MTESADFLSHRPLGRTGLMVSRLGIGAGYNVLAELARARRVGDVVHG